MQAIKQYAEVENGYLHIKLPENFIEKNVEIIIFPSDKKNDIEIKKDDNIQLKQLAGTWTDEDLAEFNQASDYFNQIDEQLWK